MVKNSVFGLLISLLFALTGCESDTSAPEIQGMRFIPGGEFEIGSNAEDPNNLAKEYGSKGGGYFENERPVHTIQLKGFYMDTYETTNLMYQRFILSTKYPAPAHWRGGQFELGKENHPTINITAYDAEEYCRWAGKRLPEEHEWETASRGPNGNSYPWGNEFDEKKANLSLGKTTPIGSMFGDRSFYGVYDMGGNVMEWTATWYEPYAGSTFTSDHFGKKRKVIKGGYGAGSGHYKMGVYFSRGSFRNSFKPDGKGLDVGFRCVKDLE